MEWTVGDRLELTLQGFAHDGRTVGRLEEGLVVFAQGGLPGRRVVVELDAVKKRLAEGRVVETLSPVPEGLGGERPAPCIHAESCGGCPWQCLPYPVQLRWKGRLVADALTRIGGLSLPDDPPRPVLPSPARASDAPQDQGGEWGYRNKMEFAFAPDPQDDAPRLGLRRRASREVVEVTGCLLQTPRTMTVLAALRELARNSGLPAWSGEAAREPGALRFAVIREPATAPRACLVELITAPGDAGTNQAALALGRALLEGPWGVTGFVHSVRASAADVAYGEKTAASLGETGLTETLRLGGRDVAFHLGHHAFFQVNTAATELLYNTAALLADGPESGGGCWDVYSGVGGLALTLAPRFARVLGLESVAAAVALARRNAAAYPQCRFETADAARLGEYFRRHGAPDLLAADPPRAGLAPRAVQAILRARPARLLLVSCNPATLARDVALLNPVYALAALQPVDLFPQTPHVETACQLIRRDA